jgi:polysaccharide export outer membrane protein
MLLLIFLMVSCAGKSIVRDIAREQGGVAKAGEKEKMQETFPFILGPGDEISVKVWRNDDLTRSIQVDPSGNIQFPLIGELNVSGLTMMQLREKMTLKLSEYLVNPHVDIVISSLKNLKIHVLGEVKSPGTIDWRTGMLAWEGIAKAGGFSNDADKKNLLLVRSENGKAVVKAINLTDMLKRSNLNQDVYLRNGDVVYVLPTFIASVARFMTHFYTIINPFVTIESGIILYPQVSAVLRGKETTGSVIVPNR